MSRSHSHSQSHSHSCFWSRMSTARRRSSAPHQHHQYQRPSRDPPILPYPLSESTTAGPLIAVVPEHPTEQDLLGTMQSCPESKSGGIQQLVAHFGALANGGSSRTPPASRTTAPVPAPNASTPSIINPVQPLSSSNTNVIQPPPMGYRAQKPTPAAQQSQTMSRHQPNRDSIDLPIQGPVSQPPTSKMNMGTSFMSRITAIPTAKHSLATRRKISVPELRSKQVQEQLRNDAPLIDSR